MKKVVLTGLFSLLILLCACTAPEVSETLEEQAFSVGELEITLPADFTPVMIEGYELCFMAKGTDVFILREGFDLSEDYRDMTVEEYGAAQIAAGELGGEVSVQQNGEVSYYRYTAETAGGAYRYVTCLYKSKHAFWTVQFAVAEAEADARESGIFRWASGVKFTSK